MPAILDADGLDAWLGDDADEALSALVPFPSTAMIARPVSTAVNRADRDDPHLIDSVDPIVPEQRLF